MLSVHNVRRMSACIQHHHATCGYNLVCGLTNYYYLLKGGMNMTEESSGENPDMLGKTLLFDLHCIARHIPICSTRLY